MSAKLADLLMKNEEVGYIGVQKKPAINVFPDSMVLTNRRIIICKPKNLGLSMDFTDYAWANVAGVFMKENILGSEFSFNTQTDITISIDYIPKIQARKMYTFAKEQLELLKEANAPNIEEKTIVAVAEEPVKAIDNEEIEEPTAPLPAGEAATQAGKNQGLASLSKEELFDKLQNYKKLLDNGLILQEKYDAFKIEILGYV